MIRESNYNFKIPIKDGKLLLYNTKTGAVAAVKENILQSLNNPKENLPSDVIMMLKTEGFLIPEEKDEIVEIQEWHNKHINDSSLISLTLLPAEACNFACPYCFQYRKRNKLMKTEVYDAVLRLVERMALENYKQGNKTFLKILWFGGEPLLATNAILNFHKRVKELCEKFPINISGSIVTNGYFLDSNIFKQLVHAGINDFQVTLDGEKSTHDKLRVLKNGGPTFQRIYNNLKSIHNISQELKFNLAIRVNFLRSTLQSVQNLARRFVKDFGNDHRFIMYFRPVYNFETTRNDIHSLSEDILSYKDGIRQQLSLALEMFKELKSLRPEADLLSPYGKMLELLPMPTPCWCESERRYSYIIGADGLLFPCDTYVGSKEHSIGYLASSGETIYNQNFSQWKKSLFYSRDNPCLSCRLLPICMGGCRRTRMASPNKTACFLTEDDIIFSMHEYAKLLN
ncbi:Radical SAM domain protein [Petrotoga mobilis SJ95]|jgi:uncharacterized protein|uniref:Radical SAM domain protein n=1 Tax=Petrotoga mobilis (strain DSM 10674 / SJ95) TaxID=403833 RepID=A9BG21_PETMO|nr:MULTISPECIES: SPASM domain-containing protein [Petrotoga]ABX31777.1 Radical SAM domain protein [Petrotoga mobilis SJ95]MBL5980788.1 hypothetical protein [Petrotoga sp. 8T1HF07.NaAc.6.1]MDK2812411.1 uncharacterized protein [Petrotoga sp.]